MKSRGERQWSRRTDWTPAETPWARTLERMRLSRARLWDLTASNPTECGFLYPESLLAPLADPRALRYDPDPRGLRSAREAVSRYYRDHGAQVDPDRIFLTTGSSEAYSFLFRLLCDPGDEALIAQPGYPLLDVLAGMEDVRLTAYHLLREEGGERNWILDLEAVRRRITSRTRMLILVHPNNPTGHFTSPEERAMLESLCRETGLALVVDEVFLDYSLRDYSLRPSEGAPGLSFATGEHPAPVFVISGLSKIAGLPQMKAGWLLCLGEEGQVGQALERLEVIADSFLSQNAPVQCAMPQWLAGRRNIQEQILQRLRENLAILDAELARQKTISRLPVEAGWYAVLRVPALRPAEEAALDLLVRAGVAVYPGSFFGFAGDGWFVVSLLPRTPDFAAGIKAISCYFNDLKVEPRE